MEIYVIKWLDTGDISSRAFKNKEDVIRYILEDFIRAGNSVDEQVLESLFDGEYIADYAAYYKVMCL